MQAEISYQPVDKPSRVVRTRKPVSRASVSSNIAKRDPDSSRQNISRLPWLTDKRATQNFGSHQSIPERLETFSSPKSTRSESTRTTKDLNHDASPKLKLGDVRKTIDLVERLDGNNASAPLASVEQFTPLAYPNKVSSPSNNLDSQPDLNSTKSRRSEKASKSEGEPSVHLGSLVKGLRPTESMGSFASDPRGGAAPSAENSRGSISETAIMKPIDSFNLPKKIKSRPSPEDITLHDTIARLEELTREAVYLAHDAVDRQRPDEVTRIIGEAAQALHASAQPRDLQREFHNEPLVDAGGAVPWSNALHDRPSDDKTNFSGISLNNHAPSKGPEPVPEGTIEESRPFKSEPSPYHPPNIANSKAVDFAYKDRTAPEQISPTTSPPPDFRRRSKSKPVFENAHAEENTKIPMPTPSDVRAHINEYGEPPVFPRNASTTLRKPRESSSVSSSPKGDSARPDHSEPIGQIAGHNWGSDKYDESDYLPSDALHGKHHVTLNDNQSWSIHQHRRQPIARNWSTSRKRTTALVVCLNTALIGFIVGIYAGEVPAMQYSLNDLNHHVILGNVVLYAGMAITTFLFWPLPLLHGRKPYTLAALGIALPLQLPQAVMVSTRRVGNNSRYMVGLLVPRALAGLALGFCHINLQTTLLDLFGASLQSTHPHGEFVVVDDVRRHGGGMGLWLGFWSFCFIGSLSLGFMIGADIVSGLNVSWGFYITVVLIAGTLFLDVLTPETRRSPHRRTMAEIELPNMRISRRVARGEVRMHVYGDGPKWWWEEVFAGVYLSLKMIDQPGFGLIALYLGWVYGEVVLIIILLGNLLSIGYYWRPEFVGLGVFAIFVGAFLAIPNTKANFFSKSRVRGGRTDSMTFEPRITWTSHMVRRAAFMVLLPLAGIAYTLASAGPYIQYMVPIIFSGLIGYISNLAIAECHGLIMEAFDTSDLQPGSNSKHRLQSLPAETRSRRTAYTSYPRVTAGLMTAHTVGFAIAAAATGVGGAVTRGIGAQKATGITAGVLFGLTILLTLSLWRFKRVQVTPDHLFGANFGSGQAGDKRNSLASIRSDKSWRAVVVGNPSGKFRRMNLLELGGLSRWTEIRRLNRLLNRSNTQPLNPGWQ